MDVSGEMVMNKIYLCPVRDLSPVEIGNVDEMFRPVWDGRTYIVHLSTNLLCLTAQKCKFNRISGVDFANHSPDRISFVPPEHLLSEWETDYKQMQENMIYGEAMPFAGLIKKLKELQSRINKIQWN